METDLEDFVVGFALNVARGFLGEFQINGTFGGLFFDHLEVEAELSAGFRDLELDYADNCVKKIKDLWKGPVQLFTTIEDEPFEIS